MICILNKTSENFLSLKSPVATQSEKKIVSLHSENQRFQMRNLFTHLQLNVDFNGLWFLMKNLCVTLPMVQVRVCPGFGGDSAYTLLKLISFSQKRRSNSLWTTNSRYVGVDLSCLEQSYG